MVEQPTPEEIGRFLDKINRIDKDIAVSHYVRTGLTMREAPDATAIKVIAWLEELRGNSSYTPATESKP